MIAFERDAVAHAVHEAADAADALDDEAHLGVLDPLDHHLEAAMDVTDGRDRVHNLLIFEDQVQDERLRQHRMLRAHRNYGALHDAFPAASRAARRALIAA